MTVGLMSINTRKDQDYLKIYIYILLALHFLFTFFCNRVYKFDLKIS